MQLELLAFLNFPFTLQLVRRKISEQIALEIISNYDIRDDWKLHYVNAILNHHADVLAIEPYADDYYIASIESHNVAVLQDMCTNFLEQIKAKLTLEACIEYLVSACRVEKKS